MKELPRYILRTSYGLLIPVKSLESYKELSAKYQRLGIECTLAELHYKNI